MVIADIKKRDLELRKKGMAPPGLIRTAKPGAVYTVLDKAIDFPTDRLDSAGERTTHVTRYAIVMQAAIACTSISPLSVTVIPCSSSGSPSTGDYRVPDGELAFPEKTVAYVTLMQPLLKSELVSYKGDLSPATLVELQAMVAQHLGLVGRQTVVVP